MTDVDHVSAIARESGRFLAVLRDADPRARVPSCPDSDATALLRHLTGVQWFWATVVEEGRQDAEGLEEPSFPEPYDELLGAFEEQAARLARVRTEAHPATEVYTWHDDRTVGYIRRRQAHEALIHRLDAELTTGRPDVRGDRAAFDGSPPWSTSPSTEARVSRAPVG